MRNRQMSLVSAAALALASHAAQARQLDGRDAQAPAAAGGQVDAAAPIAPSTDGQEGQAATDGAAQGDIVVTGYARSLRQAIETKRNANAVVDAISAEDIGKFPDRNVGESLSHVPGVSIDRRFGEGEKVAILGTDPALNRLLVDGHGIASADWGGNDNDPTSRTFNYSLLAPELVDRLEVYKSPEARLEEGSLGGTVIVRTRRPLDLEANTLFGSAGYIYNDRSEKGNARGSALYSWRNSDETFGILVAGSYEEQNIQRTGVEIFGYDNLNGGASPFLTTDAAGRRVLRNPNAVITGGSAADLDRTPSPNGINFASFQQKRQRISGTGTVQWRPAENLTLTLNGLHIEGKYDNYSQALYVVPGSFTGDALQSATISDGRLSAATFGPGAQQTAQIDFLRRLTKLSNDNVNFFGDWVGDDGSKLSFAAGWSKAKGGSNPQNLFTLQTNLPYSYTLGRTTASVNYAGDVTDPKNFFTNPVNNAQTIEGKPVVIDGRQVVAAGIGGRSYSVTTDRDIFANFDATIPLGGGFIKEFLVGARVINHDNRIDANAIASYIVGPVNASSLGVPFTTTPGGLFNGTGGSGNTTDFINLPDSSLFDILDNSINAPLSRRVAESSRVQERVVAAYSQLNFEGGGLRGNLGGRLVYTRDRSTYALAMPTAANPNPEPMPTQTNTQYLKFLPSLNIAYEARPNLIFRGAVARVLARPRYQDLAATFTQNDTTFDASGGNPNLLPYESNNYEITAEYYPKAGALLSLELYRREISNYIVTTRVEGISRFNSLTGKLENRYSASIPVNGGDAKVNGVLVNGQAEIWHGFGIQANYAYQDSSTTTTLDTTAILNLPYLSKHTVNVIPYFESGPFQARVSYNYRSSYFRVIGRLGALDIVAPYHQLDASASFDLTRNITISANAQNLLDETYLEYSGTPNLPLASYKNGRTFVGSISFRM